MALIYQMFLLHLPINGLSWGWASTGLREFSCIINYIDLLILEFSYVAIFSPPKELKRRSGHPTIQKLPSVLLLLKQHTAWPAVAKFGNLPIVHLKKCNNTIAAKL